MDNTIRIYKPIEEPKKRGKPKNDRPPKEPTNEEKQ